MLTPQVARAVEDLLRALNREIVCGSLTLNFNDRQFSTYDVKEHCKAPHDLVAQKVVDKRATVSVP